MSTGLQKHPKHYRSMPCRGLTLVELLVVLGVVSVLTAIILPSIKTVLTDRKSSQTAIVVRNFFEAARARAIGKNRSVAVVLERLSSRVDPLSAPNYVSATASGTVVSQADNFVPYNACIRMSLAEEPLPITQANFPVALSIIPYKNDRNLSPNTIPAYPYTGSDDLFSTSNKENVRIFQVKTTVSSDVNVSLLLAEYLISGSEISFGNSKRRFAIVSPRRPSTHHRHLPLPPVPSTPPPPDSIWFSVANDSEFVGLHERASEPFEAISDGEIFSTFKIYPRPKPIYSEMVQLPRGMCIDLSLSGFGGDPSPLLTDYRTRFASDWIVSLLPSPPPVPTPAELRPVYICFTPDGNLSHVWANERRVLADTNYAGNLTRIDATQDIFLHIGKIDQVVMPLDDISGKRSKEVYAAKVQSGEKQNLSDVNSYVIRLSPKSGAISASPAVGLDTQIGILGLNPNALSLGDLIELSRRGTYSSNVTSQ